MICIQRNVYLKYHIYGLLVWLTKISLCGFCGGSFGGRPNVLFVPAPANQQSAQSLIQPIEIQMPVPNWIPAPIPDPEYVEILLNTSGAAPTTDTGQSNKVGKVVKIGWQRQIELQKESSFVHPPSTTTSKPKQKQKQSLSASMKRRKGKGQKGQKGSNGTQRSPPTNYLPPRTLVPQRKLFSLSRRKSRKTKPSPKTLKNSLVHEKETSIEDTEAKQISADDQ